MTITAEEFLKKESNVSPSVFSRMNGSIFQGKSPVVSSPCDRSSVAGQLILITGGSGGIGAETAKALYQWGARVIIASRNKKAMDQTCSQIQRSMVGKPNEAGTIDNMILDLSDMQSVISFSNEFAARYPKDQIYQLIENAGVWPRSYSKSPQ